MRNGSTCQCVDIVWSGGSWHGFVGGIWVGEICERVTRDVETGVGVFDEGLDSVVGMGEMLVIKSRLIFKSPRIA